MNVSLVKIEALNDCLLLLEASDDISITFKEAVRQERHFALMTDAAEPGKQSAADLLEYCRKAMKDESQDDRLLAKLALALGLKALQGVESNPSLQWFGEEGRYCDAFVYRLYYIKGNEPGPQASSIRALFKALRQRNTIELHTFVANTALVDEWFELISQWDRNAEKEIQSFAETVSRPDLLTSAYEIAGTPFYSAGDALLQLLVQLRRGERVDGQAVRSALSAEPASVYGRMVRNGFQQLLSVQSDFREASV
ncbi:MAG: hypothetical protein K0S39_3050 [Paenibacillus sp.]|jgi:hypothetical protein|nr:hypothetical protein [Paenibacillus sp.]